MQNHTKFINCKDLEIVISVEGQIIEKHPFYYPVIVLIYVKKGELIIELDNKTTVIERGNFVLVNKHTYGLVHKKWTEEEQEASICAFIFQHQFVEKVKQQFRPKTANPNAEIQPIYVLPPNHILTGLFDSVLSYAHQEELDTNLVALKTLEAMMGILNFHPECHDVFLLEQKDEKINLQTLIENNYMFNVPLAKLAQLSGRSLSTFSRDFKAIYHESPHKWIRKRRLLKAQELLLNTNRKPAEFYLEIGFESLAHFSRAFKKEFGMTMTEFRKSNHSKIQ